MHFDEPQEHVGDDLEVLGLIGKHPPDAHSNHHGDQDPVGQGNAPIRKGSSRVSVAGRREVAQRSPRRTDLGKDPTRRRTHRGAQQPVSAGHPANVVGLIVHALACPSGFHRKRLDGEQPEGWTTSRGISRMRPSWHNRKQSPTRTNVPEQHTHAPASGLPVLHLESLLRALIDNSGSDLHLQAN